MKQQQAHPIAQVLGIPQHKTEKREEVGMSFEELELAQNVVDRAHDSGTPRSCVVLTRGTKPCTQVQKNI